MIYSGLAVIFSSTGSVSSFKQLEIFIAVEEEL
jgi:hypothetical protein